MPAETDTEDHPAAIVTPPIVPTMPWRVRDVEARPGFRLFVRFLDGLVGTVDMSALVTSPESGVFAQLRDEAAFAQVRVENGAVSWPGALDLAPDAMHAAIRKDGEWTLA